MVKRGGGAGYEDRTRQQHLSCAELGMEDGDVKRVVGDVSECRGPAA